MAGAVSSVITETQLNALTFIIISLAFPCSSRAQHRGLGSCCGRSWSVYSENPLNAKAAGLRHSTLVFVATVVTSPISLIGPVLASPRILNERNRLFTSVAGSIILPGGGA